FRLIARSWGCHELFREWTSPQAAFQILKRLSAGRPCDFTGIEDYRHLEGCGGIQWPWSATGVDTLARSTFSADRCPDRASVSPTSSPEIERRLFADERFFTPDGKARFVFEEPRKLPETPDAEYPFILLTGRGSSAQWHTLTRTDKSRILRRLGSREL